MKRLTVQPTQSRPRVTQGTYIDWFMRRSAIAMAFCYREQLDFERLARALAVVLSDFPDFCGRLRVRAGAIQIEHGTAGVLLEFAERAEPFGTLALAAKAGRSKLLCPKIRMLAALRGRAPLFAARLTHTSDGSVLSVTWHHSVGDMHSATLLLEAWALAYREQPHARPLEVADREEFHVRHLRDTPNVASCMRVLRVTELLSLLRFALQPTRCVDFEFSQAAIGQLRAAASGQVVTTHDLVCAHVFSTLRQNSELSALSKLAVVVNYRKRCNLPNEMLGNLMSMAVVSPERDADTSDVAAALRTEIQALGAHRVDYHVSRRFVADLPSALARQLCMHDILSPAGSALVVSSWARFGLYALQFGDTAPALCLPLLDKPGPLVAVVLESTDARGLLVSVHLPIAALPSEVRAVTPSQAQPRVLIQ